MKKVLVLFGDSELKKAVPFSKKIIQNSYECLYRLAKEKGIQMYRASCDWYDYEKHIFKYAWTYEDGNGWKYVHSIKPDLIYDKTKAKTEIYYKKELIAKKYPFINNLRFTGILENKLITSMIFRKWSKKSWIVNSPKELQKIFPKIKTQRIVIKPISESGGTNIQIIQKEKALKKMVFNNNYLVQEFLNSSFGVPGVSNCMHDLRIVFVNNKIIYAYIRKPAKGSYLANLSQGGSLSIVPIDQLPHSHKPIIRCVNDVFEIFNPRIYSVDFMFDENKKPWIVELNSMPGLYFTPQEKPYILNLYQELIEVFLKKLC